MVPDAETGSFTTFSLPWTSVGYTTPSGNFTPLSNAGNVQAVIIDSGSTGIALPGSIYQALAAYFNVQNNPNYGAIVDCNEANGTVDFGFDNSITVPVPFYELAVPIYDEFGNPVTDQNGNMICLFGILNADEVRGGEIVFGDTLLRSLYVVFDLDNKVIALGATKFNSTSSNIVPISSGSPIPSASSVAAVAGVFQTATVGPAIVPGTPSGTGGTSTPAHTLGGVSSSVTGSSATQSSVTQSATGTGTAPTGSSGGSGTSSSASASTPTHSSVAPAARAPFEPVAMLVLGMSFMMMLLGGAFILFG
jgi:hypothetical protein